MMNYNNHILEPYLENLFSLWWNYYQQTANKSKSVNDKKIEFIHQIGYQNSLQRLISKLEHSREVNFNENSA